MPPTPSPVTFRRNLLPPKLSPSHLSSVISSSLPSPTYFSSLDVNAATDTLCSTLTSSRQICPLSSRPAQTAPSNPWLSDVLREHRTRLTPLLKKPTLNTSLIENYRPVSLLPFIAKTFERVVFNQVSLFLSQNNKLDAKQSGFRIGHSTETALLSVTDALRIAKADSKSSVLILLDLSAAFDTVNHQILLSTLSSLDITGIPLCWFESYLTGRSFKVAWGGEVSKAHQLVTGVPQSSVLGPLLFSTYTTSWVPSYRHMVSPTIYMLMTQSSISHFDQMIQR